jgi:SAM-dependent methyltransferase
MEATETKSDSVDVAVSLFGAFSYAEPREAVRELARTLVPGGRFLVMVLGRRYRSRESYILKGSGVAKRLYREVELRDLFDVSDFEYIQVRGLSCLVDALPEWLPQRFFDLYAAIEHKMLGWLLPDANYFLMVSGRKRGDT